TGSSRPPTTSSRRFSTTSRRRFHADRGHAARGAPAEARGRGGRLPPRGAEPVAEGRDPGPGRHPTPLSGLPPADTGGELRENPSIEITDQRPPRRDRRSVKRMSVDESVVIVLEAFRAVEQRDDQRLEELYDAEVEFHWPPSLPYGGSSLGGVRDTPGPSWSE